MQIITTQHHIMPQMNRKILIAFGCKLKSLRIKAGFTQEQLATKAGLHRTYVSSVERGERNVSLVNIVKFANALETTLFVLVGDLNEKP